MYSELTIEGFRLFKHLELKNLGQINLFFGPNNCGKTTVLEAIFTHACGSNFVPFQEQIVFKRQGSNVLKRLDIGERFITLFNDTGSIPYCFKIIGNFLDNSTSYSLEAQFRPASVLADLDPIMLGPSADPLLENWQFYEDQEASKQPNIPPLYLGEWKIILNGKSYPYRIELPSNIPISSPLKMGAMHDILSHRRPDISTKIFSYLKRYRLLEEFTQEMKKTFSPAIAEIDQIPYPDGSPGPIYVGLENGKKLPLYVFGDGMRRWFFLIGQMVVFQNSFHCIEEIDETFHPAAYPNLSRQLIQYAEKYKNQLFLTSHSIEFADVFLETLYGEEGIVKQGAADPVRLFSLKPSQTDGIPDVWVLTGHDAYEKRKKYNLELR